MYGSSDSTSALVRNMEGEGANRIEVPGRTIGTVDALNGLPKESVVPPENVNLAVFKDPEDKEEGMEVYHSFANRGGETVGRKRRVVGGLDEISRVASRSASVVRRGWLKTA